MPPWAWRGWHGGALGMLTNGRIEGLREIAGQFDAMLIDQFGVIHDGRNLYPGAAQVLAELRKLQIPVVVITNSGKRAAASETRIVEMGIARDHFVACVSSGEVAYQLLGVTTALVIGKQGEDYGFDQVERVYDPREADIMLILGSDAPDTSLEDYGRMFQGIDLPCICCNPDKLAITANGLQPAAGAIAEVYAKQGGKVTWIGKPHAQIYGFALDLLERPGRVLCIGDSAEHDVAGGRGAGLSTLLVQQGVSAGQQHEFHPYPDYIMQSFQWS